MHRLHASPALNFLPRERLLVHRHRLVRASREVLIKLAFMSTSTLLPSTNTNHARMHLRQLWLMVADLIVALTENLPLGILQIIYSVRVTHKMDAMSTISLIMSWYRFAS